MLKMPSWIVQLCWGQLKNHNQFCMLSSVIQNDSQPPQKELLLPLLGISSSSEIPLFATQAKRQLDQLSYALSIYNDRIVAQSPGHQKYLSFDGDIVFWTTPEDSRLWLASHEMNITESFILKTPSSLTYLNEALKPVCPQKGFFDKYELGTKLGEGKNSDVHKVLRKEDGMLFACKLQHNSSSFLRQIETLRQLKHPNLIYFYEFFIEPDQMTYTIMEYEDGGDLLSILQEKGKLHPKQKIKIVYDLLNGLEYLRSKGIVHRDIKPENILYSNDDQNYKIGDFGFAKRIGDKSEKITGTPGYIAPEVIQNTASEINIYSDVYSLGLVFFEIFTGKQFYEGNSQDQILQKNLKGESWRKRQSGIELNSPEKELLDKMVRSKPQNRRTPEQILKKPCLKKLMKAYGIQSRDSGSTKSKDSSDSEEDSGSLMEAVKKMFRLRSSA